VRCDAFIPGEGTPYFRGWNCDFGIFRAGLREKFEEIFEKWYFWGNFLAKF